MQKKWLFPTWCGQWIGRRRPGTKKSKSIGLKDESGPGYIKQEEVDAEDYLEVELNKVGVEEEEAYDEDTWGQDLNYLPPYPENSFGAGSNNSAKSKVSRAGVKRKVEPDNEWLPGVITKALFFRLGLSTGFWNALLGEGAQCKPLCFTSLR